jgi:hypothetical protein
MRPILAFLITPTLLAGCLSSEPFSGGPAVPLPTHVREYSHDGLRFVALEPVDVGRMPTLQGSVTLSVGALYMAAEAPGGEHTLALVLRSVNADDRPILASGSNLLLEVDGTYLASSPRPGGHTYEVERSARGVTETVMVPIDPAMMADLVDAEVVRGRLGPWFSFVLPRTHRAALTGILARIPSDVRYHSRPSVSGFAASD